MRSIEDQISEIRRRKSLYTTKNQVRRLSYLATVMGLLLIAVLMFAPGVKGTGRVQVLSGISFVYPSETL